MHRPTYFNWCPSCGAQPRERCRTLRTRRSTDTHMARMNSTDSVHSEFSCGGPNCVLHNPTEHHMLTWPMGRRFDLSPPMVERICRHGIGHPDPDAATWAQNAVVTDPGKWQAQVSDGVFVWTHGCDGCCRPPSGEPQN